MDEPRRYVRQYENANVRDLSLMNRWSPDSLCPPSGNGRTGTESTNGGTVALDHALNKKNKIIYLRPL